MKFTVDVIAVRSLALHVSINIFNALAASPKPTSAQLITPINFFEFSKSFVARGETLCSADDYDVPVVGGVRARSASEVFRNIRRDISE